MTLVHAFRNDKSKKKKMDMSIKIILAGDCQVGKKKFMLRCVKEDYDEDYTEVVPKQFMEKDVKLKNNINIQHNLMIVVCFRFANINIRNIYMIFEQDFVL